MNPAHSGRLFLHRPGSAMLGLVCAVLSASSADDVLRVSVYCTAGDVQQHLATPEGRERTLRALQPMGVSRLFLEGRRGDEYVSPAQLQEVRDFFAARGITCSGGIATVPGSRFGARQQGGLDWLDWEHPETRAGVARFFTENAPLFDELIVDDFFCTGDTSATAEQAKGPRSWGEYRRGLLVSLIQPVITGPTRKADRRTRLIIKFPQWYDRFHLFGYDPPRMAAAFHEVWVGTEVRNPETRRMGFVQPTEGYMNYRWLASVAGQKVHGAWFDHIECSAQNFVDQAFQSVLAGAEELTLFRLGDVMVAHPGDALFVERLPELRDLAVRVKGRTRRGVAFYKPPGSESAGNMYLADYLGMIGLPVLPVARYPTDAAVAFLPVQAAADPRLLEKMQRHLRRGTTLMVTPALLRALGPDATKLAGVEVEPVGLPGLASEVRLAATSVNLDAPVELEEDLRATTSAVEAEATVEDRSVPFLTRHAVGRGQVLVLNVRTFSEADFREAGEWLLAPKPLGLSRIPQPLADAIRTALLSPLRVDLQSPAGVSLVLFRNAACLYSFRGESARARFGNRTVELPPHQAVWLPDSH